MDDREQWVRFKERGDDSARDDLIMRHMRIVRYVAGRMAIHVPHTVEMDDLVGWGVMGLLDAVEKYDHTQPVKFSTYATIRVRGAIIDQIRSLDWAPRSLRAMARKVGAAKEKLRQRQAAEPTTEEVAAAMGVAATEIEDTMAQLQTAHILSLDDYVSSDDAEETRKLDVVSHPSLPNPEEAAQARERQERLVQAILQLPDQQQKVLNLYYYEELTLKEIGAVLSVTESRVCQIHGDAMKRLRKIMREGA